MKPQLQIVKPALGGPLSTTIQSRMVTISEGRIRAYGGAFCISTPIASTLESSFVPKIIEQAFAIEQEEVRWTETKDFLTATFGKGEVKVRRFEPQTVPALIAVGPKHKLEHPIAHLSTLAALSRNNTQCFRQGVWFKDNWIYAMKTTNVCFTVEGFPFEHPLMGVPSEAILALARIKANLVGVSWDRCAVQFDFDDGTALASRLLEGVAPPDLMRCFNGYENPEMFVPLEFDPGVVQQVMALKLKGLKNDIEVDMVWEGKDGVLSFSVPNGLDDSDNTGRFVEAYTVGFDPTLSTQHDFKINGEALRTILGLEPQLVGLLRKDAASPSHSLNGYGDSFAVAAQLLR